MSNRAACASASGVRRHRATAAVAMSLVILGVCSPAHADRSPFDWAFVRLDYARQEKVQHLRRFCDRLHNLAIQARQDQMMVRFFDLNRDYYRLDERGEVPDELKKKVAEFRRTLDAYYVENYFAFHDILFVDKRGNIFYTILKESDFRKNLFDETYSRTPLARCLKSDPQEETFIDFHDYDASGEPAAFFIEPVRIDGAHLGWLILQCAINKVNSLFAGDEHMGETGEAFVVNRDGYMLTESNFEGDCTILRKRLADRNIQAKFAAGHGHLTITDYRGFPALSSFEVFEFLGAKWLVVTKVDEAQVTTEHFKQHRRYYVDAIMRAVADRPPEAGRTLSSTTERKVLRVDIDEFVRANHGETLRTAGVATCTGLIACCPGKFGYLAHISPLDRVYGAEGTNLVGQITKKIKTYDIYRYEMRRVRFVVVANHFESLPSLIDRLVDEGFLLSQISMLYNARASRANISYDYSEDRVVVEWSMGEGASRKCIQDRNDARNLENIVREAIYSDSDQPQPSANRSAATDAAVQSLAKD